METVIPTPRSALTLGPAFKLMVMCLVLSGAGLGFVWQKNQVYALGEAIQEREQRLESAKRENRRRQDVLAHLSSPRFLDARVRELSLDLQPPEPERILRLAEEPRLETGAALAQSPARP